METAPIILFDGVCNLCNGLVQYIIARDPSAKFLFASQQSEAGQKLLEKFAIPQSQATADTVIVIEGERVYRESDAALRILKNLDSPFRFLYIGKVLPRFFRDGIYRFVARNRYQWFGKQDSCMVPTSELRARFLS